MIKKLSNKDTEEIAFVINEASVKYKPIAKSYKYPFVTNETVYDALGLEYFGYFKDSLIAVMGLQEIDDDISLVRQAYVLPFFQRQGIGEKLISHIMNIAKESNKKKLLVGTYSGAYWAIAFYEKNGFVKVTNSQELLAKYWGQISVCHREESLILENYLLKND